MESGAFIEKYLPNYFSSQKVAEWNDLLAHVDNEIDQRSPFAVRKQSEADAVELELFREATEALLKEQSEAKQLNHYAMTHSHRHGTSLYQFYSAGEYSGQHEDENSLSDYAELFDSLGADVELGIGEWVEFVQLETENIPTV